MEVEMEMEGDVEVGVDVDVNVHYYRNVVLRFVEAAVREKRSERDAILPALLALLSVSEEMEQKLMLAAAETRRGILFGLPGLR